MARSEISGRHPADENHEVLTVVTPHRRHRVYRREPCAECPWRKDAKIGAFPEEAFRHSARTCYDLADTTFACHMSGKENPAICAGFLLSSGAGHNLAIRVAAMSGSVDPNAVSSEVALYENYREMAVANGVDPDDPALRPCR